MKNIILAIDLGSNAFHSVVASISSKNEPQILLSLSRPSRGIKKGVVVDIEEATEGISSLVSEIELMLNTSFRTVITGVNGPHLGINLSKGVSVTARPDGEISEDDIERAINASGAYVLQPNRTLLHVIPKNFILDGVTAIKNPLGMTGLRLEVESFLIDAFSPAFKNINKAFEGADLRVLTTVANPLAGARAALNRQDRELGTLCLDLGAETTGLCVFEDDNLLTTRVFPLGGNHLTNDIAVGLQILREAAEKIKIAEGVALVKKAPKNEIIELGKFVEGEEGSITKKFLAEIIEARLSEIFDLVIEELKAINRFNKLPGGVILYGGTTKIPGIKELAREKLQLPVRLACPEIDWFKENPETCLITCLGLILWQIDSLSGKQVAVKNNWWRKFFDLFKSFIP